MSTNFITFHPSTICAAARCRAGSNSSSWFTPLFGWPKTPDYIESAADPEPKGSRFVPRGFTDEKAKQLRMMTTGKEGRVVAGSSLSLLLSNKLYRVFNGCESIVAL